MDFNLIAGELCLDFVNTLDNRPVPERLKELLCSYEDLTDWATHAGAIESSQRVALNAEAKAHPGKAAVVLRRAVELREALYRILEARLAGRSVDEKDRIEFSAALGEALARRQLIPTRNGFRLDWPAEPVHLESVLWPIADSAGRLLTSEDLARVRECGDQTCRWLFVDRSKNHSRRWCDMKVCGNRTKVRKFYRRSHKKK
jgi:predicted RNA-binding Zn ribbon-like protein